MKRILTALCLLVMVVGLFAQVSDVKISSGQGALSSGLDIALNTTNPKDTTKTMTVQFNSTLGQAIFLKNYSSGISIGPSGGIHYRTIWVAPFISYSPFEFVTFTSWNGFTAGDPQKPNWDVKFLFAYHAIDFKIKNFEIGYALLHYIQNKAMRMPSLKYTYSFSKKDQFIYSVTYELTEDFPMHLVSYKHSF